MPPLLRAHATTLRRGSILLALGMMALVIGLLAMHTSPSEHNAPATSSIAAHSTVHSDAQNGPTANSIGGVVDSGDGGQYEANAGQCDQSCDSGMAMAGTCLLALVLAGLLWLRSPRPKGFLQAWTTPAFPYLPLEIFNKAQRPSLIKLSINRT
ncbi:DUF6153 family protein [Arthrobacter sp. H14]|uniref:DUF6153 family protein n=1 Tax=Arthrobacter sp. H14 TaxID=1312959 RepID=UPI0004796ABB|nr:DUF6153 family protein [Arthrobacter sp. H14]